MAKKTKKIITMNASLSNLDALKFVRVNKNSSNKNTINPIERNKLTRIEVIDKNKGRLFVRYGRKVEFDVQDDGKTLKIFIDNREGKNERNSKNPK